MRGKIGILTINDYTNYGNRLQNYALQEVCKLLEYDVETIIQERQTISSEKRSIIVKITDFFVSTKVNRFMSIKKRIKIRINSKKYNHLMKKKTENLKKFTKEYINESKVNISIDNIPDSISNDYTYFITGSDQVWNPNFNFGNSIDFLEFAPANKSIAYAPSFGVSNLNPKVENQIKTYLNNINRLSVRENSGALIIKRLIDKEVPVLVDPTMLLTSEKWKLIMKEDINKPKEEYLLTYILEEVSNEVVNVIEKISKDYNLKVINLANYEDTERYAIGPSEFLDYIATAKLIITNSFHGAVFSMLFERPFIVSNRLGNSPSMNSRIDTLLNKFNLMDRKFEENRDIEEYLNPNYSNISDLLKEERLKAHKFLGEALHIEGLD